MSHCIFELDFLSTIIRSHITIRYQFLSHTNNLEVIISFHVNNNNDLE